ncbi:MAG TPA: hypothetical protein PLP16_07630 [Smithellaceae bacterium]|nr:hypothetical protein [Smithellaceae bacterium]
MKIGSTQDGLALKRRNTLDAAVRESVNQQLIDAVDRELQGAIIPRHKINKLSPSFPWSYRTLANRDSLGTGPKEATSINDRVFYPKAAILDFLKNELNKI